MEQFEEQLPEQSSSSGSEGTSREGTDKPWHFKKGQSGNPKGRPKTAKGRSFLGDMRQVYGQDARKDRTQGEKACRQWFQDDPGAFFKELLRLEKAEAPARPQPEVKDERHMKIEELIDETLADIAMQDAKKDAEFAKRPDAAEIGATLQKRLAGALEREESLRKRLEELKRGGVPQE